MNAMLRALAMLIIASAVIRGGGLFQCLSDGPPVQRAATKPRQLLGLPPDHRVSGLFATDNLPQGSAVLWWTDPAAATVILPDASSQLRIGTVPINLQQVSAAYLAELDTGSWPALPPHWQRLSIRHWDETAAVYVTAGPDGLPGIAGIDDDGNGSVDDLGELGATGSDDIVVAPGQSGYEQAATGKLLARLINRGALLPLAGALHLPPQHPSGTAAPPTEVWLELTGATNEPPQRICLHVQADALY